MIPLQRSLFSVAAGFWLVTGALAMFGIDYGPWQHFGHGAIAPDEMSRRVDAYLERVMLRT